MSCIILAIKFNENKVYKNTFYAKVGGFDVDDLNNLEYDIFYRLDFNLRVLDSEFVRSNSMYSPDYGISFNEIEPESFGMGGRAA